MKSVLIAADGSTNLPLEAIAKSLNQVCKFVRFSSWSRSINLGQGPISCPETYKSIEAITNPLAKKHSSVLIASELPYDNNYFLESQSTVVIASSWGWDELTNLPRTNGMIGFVCTILARDLDPDAVHHANTGCIYDFLWDKSGIDARLRSGVICRECLAGVRNRVRANPSERLSLFDCTVDEGLADLITLLDELAQASKREVDVLNRWQTKAGVSQDFDVFLCHNSDDKSSVRRLYGDLKDRGISPWFDEEHLRPGKPWQRELEATIPRIRTVAVIVGPNGRGPWQDVELDAFVREFVNRACPVIPVLLGDAGATPTLPIFLRAFTWVDFRKSTPDPWKQLVWGVTGIKPS